MTSELFRAPPPGHSLPYDDGEPMESERHQLQATLLAESLRDIHFAGRRDVCVAANMGVYFSELQAKTNDFRAPDVLVVLDTEYRERLSWVTWEEGGRLPDLVIEILSDSTEHVDRGAKMRIYAKIWRLPEYFLVDVRKRTVEGYRYDPIRHDFVPIAPDARGDVRSEQLDLALGWRDDSWTVAPPPWLRWVHGDGRPVPAPSELATRTLAAEARSLEAEGLSLAARARATEAEARAAEAEARAATLEARLEELEGGRK